MDRLLVLAVLTALSVLPMHRALGQSGRIATLPSPRAGVSQSGGDVPIIVLRDGSVVADLGRGYERLLRSCAAYSSTRVRPGVGLQQARGLPPAPQGGSASPAPGANGLPPAPGLSATPGGSTPRRVGVSSVAGTVGSTSTLQRQGSAWRTAGPVYLDGACYTQGRDGRLRLVRL